MADKPSLNPLLAKVKLPGRVFQLPSKGVFYPPGVLAETVVNGEVEVKPMSALVELKIRSADLLISSKIIREVCAECAPEILKPEVLLAQDVDALFLFLVASTYGNLKTIKAVHDCENADVHDYEVNLEPIIANPRNKILDHRDVLLSVDLDNGQTVKLKPVTFADAVDMMLLRQAIGNKEMSAPSTITSKELEDVVVRDILAVIESVSTGGPTPQVVTDQKQIDEWIRALPKKYIDQITEASARAADWGFDMNVQLKCKDCGTVFKHNMEMNPINFFSG
jgi:hypothetical protein